MDLEIIIIFNIYIKFSFIDFSYKILLEDKSQLIVINQKKSTIAALFKTLE